MSHVTTIKTKQVIKSLETLEAACRMLGTVELVRDAKQHKYWRGALAPCDHKIRVKNNEDAYEIGVVRKGNEFELNADFFIGGCGLVDAVGQDASRLLQAHAVVQGIEAFQISGFALSERTQLPGGAIKCVFEI